MALILLHTVIKLLEKYFTFISLCTNFIQNNMEIENGIETESEMITKCTEISQKQ